MGVLTLLIEFFVFFPVIALALVSVALVLAAGIVTGMVSFIGGLATHLVSVAVPVSVAKWARFART